MRTLLSASSAATLLFSSIISSFRTSSVADAWEYYKTPESINDTHWQRITRTLPNLGNNMLGLSSRLGQQVGQHTVGFIMCVIYASPCNARLIQ
jgi:hypothetical protein